MAVIPAGIIVGAHGMAGARGHKVNMFTPKLWAFLAARPSCCKRSVRRRSFAAGFNRKRTTNNK